MNGIKNGWMWCVIQLSKRLDDLIGEDLTGEVAQLKSDALELTGEVSQLKTDVLELTSRVETLEAANGGG